MISILKIGRTTFVLSNRQMGDSPIFEATVLHRQGDEIPPVIVPLIRPKKRADDTAQTDRRYTPRPNGKRSHLDQALERVKKMKPGSEIHGMCERYAQAMREQSPVGQTCHSSAWRYMTEEGLRGRPENGRIYNLIAWAITYCSLDVSDTYPLTYVARGVGR